MPNVGNTNKGWPKVKVELPEFHRLWALSWRMTALVSWTF